MMTDQHFEPDAPNHNHSRVLLVSSDDSTRRVLGRILCRCGYQVKMVVTGEAALEWATSQPCDIVLSEVDLPGGVCGLTMLNRLRETGITTPIVFLAEEENDRLRGALDCSDDAACLRKDASPDLVKATLAELLVPAPI